MNVSIQRCALGSLLSTLGLLASCVMPPTEPSKPPAAGEKPVAATPAADTTAATPLARMATPRYQRIDPERTGLSAAADDGLYTFLAFDATRPEPVQVFDAEGNELRAARVGSVVAIQGVHPGVLVRRGQQHSYVAVSPRAASLPKPRLEDDPEVAQARTQLEIEMTQRPAFERALERARARTSAPDSAPPGVSSSAQSGSAARPTAVPDGRQAARAANDPTYVSLPDGVMMRVFFASGGRAIVRPDDGLQRLEAEARAATVIRIAGYTDSVGSEESNSWLARRRADSIRNYLIARGIPPERVFVTWSGNAHYLAGNESEAGRALNRRVEVVFLRSARANDQVRGS